MADVRAARPRAILRALRPEQWLKNGVVLLPLVFARRFGDASAVGHAALAFALFCALASAGYLLNDCVDVELDRAHPTKRHRPIARGALPRAWALRIALVLAVAGMAGCAALAEPVLAVRFAAIYLVLTLSYSLGWKHVPWLDTLAIAAGFVVRARFGGAAVGVEVSRWLMACAFLGALTVACGKRRAERFSGAPHRTRPSLKRLTRRGADLALVAAALAFCAAYAWYTVAERTVHEFGDRRLALTIVPLWAGCARFVWVSRSSSVGEDPVRLFLRDKVLLGCFAAWAACAALAVSGRLAPLFGSP